MTGFLLFWIGLIAIIVGIAAVIMAMDHAVWVMPA